MGNTQNRHNFQEQVRLQQEAFKNQQQMQAQQVQPGYNPAAVQPGYNPAAVQPMSPTPMAVPVGSPGGATWAPPPQNVPMASAIPSANGQMPMPMMQGAMPAGQMVHPGFPTNALLSPEMQQYKNKRCTLILFIVISCIITLAVGIAGGVAHARNSILDWVEECQIIDTWITESQCSRSVDCGRNCQRTEYYTCFEGFVEFEWACVSAQGRTCTGSLDYETSESYDEVDKVLNKELDRDIDGCWVDREDDSRVELRKEDLNGYLGGAATFALIAILLSLCCCCIRKPREGATGGNRNAVSPFAGNNVITT